jgi:hypothetical protein
MLAKVEFVVPSVLNKGQGEKKISIQASDMQDAFTKVSRLSISTSMARMSALVVSCLPN